MDFPLNQSNDCWKSMAIRYDRSPGSMFSAPDTWTHEDHFLVWRYGSGWQTGQSKRHRLQPLLHLIFISILSMATWIFESHRNWVGCLQKWRGTPKLWPCLMGKALGKWGVHPLKSGCAIFFQTVSGQSPHWSPSRRNVFRCTVGKTMEKQHARKLLTSCLWDHHASGIIKLQHPKIHQSQKICLYIYILPLIYALI